MDTRCSRSCRLMGTTCTSCAISRRSTPCRWRRRWGRDRSPLSVTSPTPAWPSTSKAGGFSSTPSSVTASRHMPSARRWNAHGSSRRRDPYADVDALLVTHWHDDHFDAGAVAEHLEHNPRAVLISSSEVIDQVRAEAPRLAPSRLQAFVPASGEVAVTRVGDVPVRVIRARHNPARRWPEQHIVFLIGERAPVLHVGDADPRAGNFAALSTLPRPALAFLPFWYLSDPSISRDGRRRDSAAPGRGGSRAAARCGRRAASVARGGSGCQRGGTTGHAYRRREVARVRQRD